MFGNELDLGRWKGTGLVDGEVALPEDEARTFPSLPLPPLSQTSLSHDLTVLYRAKAAADKQHEFNAAALDMLQGMGFPLIRCQRALLATGNQVGEQAMEWLFAHMDDPGPSLTSPSPPSVPSR